VGFERNGRMYYNNHQPPDGCYPFTLQGHLRRPPSHQKSGPQCPFVPHFCLNAPLFFMRAGHPECKYQINSCSSVGSMFPDRVISSVTKNCCSGAAPANDNRSWSTTSCDCECNLGVRGMFVKCIKSCFVIRI